MGPGHMALWSLCCTLTREKSPGNRWQPFDMREYERTLGLMCELIIKCSNKYSCSLSVQPAVDVEGGVYECVCDYVFGPVSVHDVLKQPLTSPLTKQTSHALKSHVREAPGPIYCHNSDYFQREGTLKRPSLSSSPLPSFSISALLTILPLSSSTYLSLVLTLSHHPLHIMC